MGKPRAEGALGAQTRFRAKRDVAAPGWPGLTGQVFSASGEPTFRAVRLPAGTATVVRHISASATISAAGASPATLEGIKP